MEDALVRTIARLEQALTQTEQALAAAQARITELEGPATEPKEGWVSGPVVPLEEDSTAA